MLLSPEEEACWYGDGCACWGMRGGLVVVMVGVCLGVDAATGIAAAAEDGTLDVGVEPSLSDLGAGGARYDLRLWRSIMLMAHSCRSTGVRLAACKKASLSCVKGQ